MAVRVRFHITCALIVALFVGCFSTSLSFASGATASYVARLMVDENSGGDGTGLTFTCSAVGIGDRLWVTASHCVEGISSDGIQLESSNGAISRVDKVFLPDSDADLAVLRSYREISEKHLDLPDGAVRHGDRLKVTGFGSGATRSETVPLRVESAGAERLIQGKRLQHLIVGKTVGYSRICPGYSGAPAHAGGELVAIHVAGDYNPECGKRDAISTWSTEVYPYLSWISELRSTSKM